MTRAVAKRKRKRSFSQRPGQRGSVEGLDVRRRRGLRRHVRQDAAELLQGPGGRGRHQRADRPGVPAVPVLVEGRGDFRHDRSDRHDVDVGEREVRVCLEVLVADVASADDGHLVVHGEALAVHAVVHRPEPRHELEILRPPALEGIEEAHLDAGVGVDRRPHVVGLPAVHVVDQHPHAHAPVRCREELFEQEPPDGVLVEHVVLHVDAALGVARVHGPRHERVAPALQQVNSGKARVLLQLGPERPAEGGALAVGDRNGGRSGLVVGHHGAGGCIFIKLGEA